MGQRSFDPEQMVERVRAAQAGSVQAFAELVRSFQDLAVGYATSILCDHHLAEDAAQEAFVEAHRALPSLREPAAFVAWLRTIIVKHCDRMTRRRRHPVTALDAGLGVASPDPTPHEAVERSDLAAAVRAAVAALPSAEREVVLLYYMGDESQESIAAFLNVTANTVKTRLYAARRRLKKHMTHHIEASLREDRPSSNPRFVQRVISAALSLQVYAVDSRGNTHDAGSTIASRAVTLPSGAACVIEPRQTLSSADWDTIIRLIADLNIEGLVVEGQMTDAMLERIALLEHLTYLRLPGSSHVTDEGIRHLARLQRLEHLDLTGTGVTDRGLHVLGALTRLRVFRCAHTAVTDTGLANLRGCNLLERVHVMGTASGDGTIGALAGKPALSHLRTGSRVTDAGLAMLNNFPVFKVWQGGTPEVERWMSFDAEPSYLAPRGSFTNAGLAQLAGLEGLFALNIDDSRLQISADGLRPLVGLPHLGWLAFDATNEAMPIIASMPRLRLLACQDTAADNAGFVALSQSRSIEYLWGRRCYNLGARGFSALSEIPTLRGLSVSCKNVDDSALAALPSFPALREFMPMDVSDDGFRHIARCDLLESLICMYCEDTTDAATEHIARLPRLKKYSAWTTRITDRSLQVLSGIPSLESVLLHYTRDVTDAGLRDLARLPRLKEVTIEGLPRVTSEGADAFPPDVRVNILTQ